jgi:cytidine deaminase
MIESFKKQLFGGNEMDIWEEMYLKAKEEYHPEDVSPFIQAHHVVAAVQSESGKIFTGFCIEGASGVMNLCAERVAALRMYAETGETKVIRMIAFRSEPPKVNGGMPCGACREFFMQLNYDNRDMEILTDYETRRTVKLIDLIPNWWGNKRWARGRPLKVSLLQLIMCL